MSNEVVPCPNCEDGICTECGGDGCDECGHGGTCPDCDGTGLQADDHGSEEPPMKTKPCIECGHLKSEHRNGECEACAYNFAASLTRKHEYVPDEDA